MNNPENQNELFRLAVEAAPTAMILVDEAGRIVLVNAQTERLFGYPRAELIGQAIEMLVPERFRRAHPGHRGSFFAHPQTRSMGAGRDLFGLRKDGSEMPVEIGLNPFKTSTGSYALAAVVDISVLKRMQAEMIRSQNLAALGEMAATVAHEVKNPLAAISGPLQILEQDLKEGDPHKELMGEILAQVQRLDQTVRGLLAFSKPTTPARQSIPLQEFVERIGRQAGEHRQDIKVVYEGPADALLAADPALLEQVLWNLFLNGMEAMRGGGRIRVVAQSTPGAVELSVVDTGSGIPPDLLQKLFKPFVTTKTTGTGLGLSLCRKIVEAHRGTIEITSAPGAGTTVLLRFPHP